MQATIRETTERSFDASLRRLCSQYVNAMGFPVNAATGNRATASASNAREKIEFGVLRNVHAKFTPP